MAAEKLLVFVLGAPGAGKGTQCELIVKEYGWNHISAGDLLRTEVEAGTAAGKEAQSYLEAGTMVPSSMIIGLLKAALGDAKHTKVLIDGFPRVLDQLTEFESRVRPCDTALFYNVPEEVASARILQRAATSHRCDDNAETIKRRFVVFRDESMQVITALQAQGRVAEVDASAPKEDVFAATRRVIEQLEEQLASKQQAAATGAAADADGAATEAVPVVAAAAAVGAAVAAAVPSTPSNPVAAVASPKAAAGGAASTPPASPLPAAAVASPAASPAASPVAVSLVAAVAAAPTSPLAVTAATDAAAVSSLQMDLSGIRTPIVVCGPSGVGKGTLIAKLMGLAGHRFGFSVSHTTRAARPGEVHGTHYYFTDLATMQAQVAAGMFLEHALVHDNMYGTSLAAVARVSAEGKHCVLDIDVQGAAQVRKSALGAHCLFIFVAPPSHVELERRLRARGTEAEDKVQQRLANAHSEISKAQEPGLFHHTLVNDDLEAAFAELQRIINARVPGLLPGAAAAPADGGSEAAAKVAAPLTPAPAAAAAGAAAAAAAAAASAAGPPPPPQQQQQQPLANGTPAPETPPVASHGSTATLLDFGFGAASASAASPGKALPVRQYLDAAVIPVLREGLKALNVARPDDPLQYLADYLVSHKAAAGIGLH